MCACIYVVAVSGFGDPDQVRLPYYLLIVLSLLSIA